MIDFTMPGHPAPVPQTWKQCLVQSSPLNRSKGRIVMKTSCVSCARRARGYSDVILTARERAKPSRGLPAALRPCPLSLSRAEWLKPATSLQGA